MTQIIEYFSVEKVSTYKKLCYGDNNLALELYDWNIRLSESFYTPLNYFEVVLRNICNNSIKNKYKDDKWYLNQKIIDGRNPKKGLYIKTKVDNAFSKLIGYNKKYSTGTDLREVNSADVVSSFELGFWVALFTNNYMNFFWQNCFKYVFIGEESVEALHDKLNLVRSLRNRIFHHENILKSNLYEIYTIILDVLNNISPITHDKLIQVSNFETQYERYKNFYEIKIEIKKPGRSNKIIKKTT